MGTNLSPADIPDPTHQTTENAMSRLDRLTALAQRMSTSAQEYARTGDTRRYEACHGDLDCVLDMLDQEKREQAEQAER